MRLDGVLGDVGIICMLGGSFLSVRVQSFPCACSIWLLLYASSEVVVGRAGKVMRLMRSKATTIEFRAHILHSKRIM